MTAKPTAPERGDVVWLDHDPHAGHEQAGHRPALVLSPRKYNAAAGLILCCPVTTKVKGNPFEVPLAGTNGLEGVVLSDQVHSFDWAARRAVLAGRAADDVVADVIAKLKVLLISR